MKISKTYQTINFIKDSEDYNEESDFIYENEEMSVDDLMHEMTLYVEPSDFPLRYPLNRHVWFTQTDGDQDIHTGSVTYESWHIDQATDLEMKKLFILLKRGGVK